MWRRINMPERPFSISQRSRITACHFGSKVYDREWHTSSDV